MNIDFLTNFAMPTIMGICLCVGYVLKYSFPSIKNKYIPCMMAILGVILAIWINGQITPDVILTGLFSGLSSTGLHQVFKNIIGGE